MDGYLILEDGTTYHGTAIGAAREVITEIVFNTSMTGYLEVLTDPSYAGQAVVMTYPLIGNYGINRADMESGRAWPDAFLVREIAQIPSSWRSENTIQNFLRQQGIPGIAGLDTRALTKHLRSKGTMNGCITTRICASDTEKEILLERIRSYRVSGAVMRTTAEVAYEVPWEEAREADREAAREADREADRECASDPLSGRAAARIFDKRGGFGGRVSDAVSQKRIALLDVGAKRSIIRMLQRGGCAVTVFPADTPAEKILSGHPDGILISNGPGDPKENTELIRQISILADSGVPIFAICLGHQLMALAMGADTYKLKYGHRGGNHPVKDLATGRVYITSQNHGYAVDPDSMDPAVAEEAFRNVNDGTNEGWRYKGRPILTVQYHPEASPGPNDSGYLFGEFLNMMENTRLPEGRQVWNRGGLCGR